MKYICASCHILFYYFKFFLQWASAGAAATGDVQVAPVPMAGGYPPASTEDWSVEPAVTDWSAAPAPAAAPTANDWGGSAPENWN